MPCSKICSFWALPWLKMLVCVSQKSPFQTEIQAMLNSPYADCLDQWIFNHFPFFQKNNLYIIYNFLPKVIYTLL